MRVNVNKCICGNLARSLVLILSVLFQYLLSDERGSFRLNRASYL